MKQLLMGVFAFAFLHPGTSCAQTVEQNSQKYWKFRNDLRENFVKIGASAGESVVARALKPLDCIDNINYDGVGYGEMHFGDGTIRHGYYLGLLATEYRLLKDAGADVTGVLNELYYALQALNRLDKVAEGELSPIYGYESPEALNGYYLREDIPDFFAEYHWGNSKLDARCVNSPHFETNNAAKLNNVSQGWYAYPNSYQNTPSADQFSALMLGFSLIHKLVDDIYVKPPPEEVGFKIVSETKAIVNRMMTYLDERNWMWIDVNGWPVNSGGGDMLLLAYPYYVAAKRITGNDYNATWTRRLAAFYLNDVQFCLTGYGVKNNNPQERDLACAAVSEAPATNGEMAAAEYLSTVATDPGEDNNQNESAYQTWLADGPYHGEIELLAPIWNNPNFITELINEGKIQLASWPLKLFQFRIVDRDLGSNPTICINAGVASRLWTGQELMPYTAATGNYQAELMNAVLRSEVPPRQKNFYEAYINDMSLLGSYNFVTKIGSTNNYFTSASPNGWAADHKWTFPEAASGGVDEFTGMFNALDYMLFYNLYYLSYKSSLPAFNTDEEYYFTPTPENTVIPDGGDVQAFLDAQTYLNKKLKFLHNKTEDYFAPYGNSITAEVVVQPYFPSYSQLSIYTTKFQTAPLMQIQPGGNVRVKTRFVICNGRELQIKPGGSLNIEQSETSYKGNAKIVSEGTITIHDNATLRVHQAGKLVLKAGSTLNMGDNSRLIIEDGAILEFEEGAILGMNTSSSMKLKNATMKVLGNGQFSIVQNEAVSGSIIIEGLGSFITDNSEQGGTIFLQGTSPEHALINLQPNATLVVGDLTYGDIDQKQFVLKNAGVQVGSGALLDIRMKMQASDSKISASGNNQGIKLQVGAKFTMCSLLNIPVNAVMDYYDNGIVEFTGSSITSNLSGLSAQYMVNVTGQGYKFSSSTVKGKGLYGIKSQGLTLASLIENSTVGFNTVVLAPTNTAYTGIYDVSNVELTIRNSHIIANSTGVYKQHDKLSLRCNTFSGNVVYNVSKAFGYLNGNSTTGGGYNKFMKTSTGKNIFITSCKVDCSAGYNYIELADAGSTIKGQSQNYDLLLQRNQWNAANTAPSNFYTFTGSVATPTVYTSPVAEQQLCPMTQGPVPPTVGKSSASDYRSVYSSVLNDSIRMDQLYYLYASYMSAYNDSTPDDLLALRYMYDMFSIDNDSLDSVSRELQWLTHSEMKKTLENAFGSGLLTAGTNIAMYDEYVEKYALVTTALTEPVIDENNFMQQFNLEIDKAHLLRLIRHYDKALNILTQLENCGIDSVTQSQVNYWKQLNESELAYEQIQVSPADTLLFVDTSGYNDPSMTINGYSFGADISELDNIVYPNCGYFRGLGTGTPGILSAVKVSPNPAHDYVTVSIESGTELNVSQVSVQQLNGTLVHECHPTFDNGQSKIRLPNIAPGTYILIVQLKSGDQYQAKLVIE